MPAVSFGVTLFPLSHISSPLSYIYLRQQRTILPTRAHTRAVTTFNSSPTRSPGPFTTASTVALLVSLPRDRVTVATIRVRNILQQRKPVLKDSPRREMLSR